MRWRARRTDRVPTSPSGRRTPGGRPSSRAARARGCSRTRERARRRARATRGDGTGRARRAGTRRRTRRVWNTPRASQSPGVRATRRVARRLNVAVVRERQAQCRGRNERLFQPPRGLPVSRVAREIRRRRRELEFSRSLRHNAGARVTLTSWPSNFRNGIRYLAVARRRSAHGSFVMRRAPGDARVPAGRLVFFSVFALLTNAAGGETECYCDGWYSTNTRTLLYPTQDATALIVPGMSYFGTKSTTVNGMECMPWADVFEACTAGFQNNEIELRSSSMSVWEIFDGGPHTQYGDVTFMTQDFLHHMTPGPFGIRGDVLRPSPFDDDENLVGGHNHCRLVPEAGFLGPRLVPRGPFCFVDTSDSSANHFTRDDGWLFSNLLTDALREKCPQVTPVPCGISRCEPDAAPGSAVTCSRSAADNGGATSAQLLMANGGMELWRCGRTGTGSCAMWL